ncbi:hypothetical protein G6011_00707 [Alternaria panax]|uniref:Uncharacterized protein n=1 Tax=Alternaria panax TaxID=48097 RepID=A0AAD4IJM6_9PLEO|nr:hypothetical protein G6011_00707 [Alternaria panax]
MSTTMNFTALQVLKLKSATLIASSDTSLKAASTSITKVEKKVVKIDTAVAKLDHDVVKLQGSQNNLKATIEFPKLVADASALEQALSKIRVLEFRMKQEMEEKMRYQKKFNEAALEALRAKKENKSLTKTVAAQSLAISDIRSEVELYFTESTEGYERREASHEAYAAELECLLQVV